MLYPKQHAAIFDPARHSFIEASTKSGKTMGCIIWQIDQCFKRVGHHWWVAPISAQAKIAFRRAQKYLPKSIVTSVNKSEQTITLVNGTVWSFKSGENTDSLFGEDVMSAVIDEASRCRAEVWDAIRSTLTATRGPTRVIGNVKGRKNWFYKLCRKAESGLRGYAYHKLTAYDAVDGGVLALEEIEDAKRDLPEHVFLELYKAEASEDGANPFKISYINACVKRADELADGLADGPPVAWGIDVAKSVDWTVLVGINVDGDVCDIHRFQRSWKDSIPRIKFIVGDVEALIDSTGVGDAVLEWIDDTGFTGFKFSSTSKQQLMEGLAIDIASGFSIPEGVLADELRAFEYHHYRTGVRYSAPEGEHDDCVCALALARAKWRSTQNDEWWL